MRRPLLFYSAWPLDYHNQEAAWKARAFAAAGFDTVYVAGVGIRNPRPASLGKAADRLAAALQTSRTAPDADDGLRTASVLVAPPRQLAPMRALNVRWLRRQLVRIVGRPGAVAWIRWPTPELVAALPALAPAAVVYECVDAYHHTPGIRGAWARRFEAAERALVERAERVVVPGEHLARRFRAWGAAVEVVPHGVDLRHFPAAPQRQRTRGEATLGFVGTLDYRLDRAVLRHVARQRPAWRLRLVGPVQEGFDPGDFADLPNVSIEPQVPYQRVGALLAEFDVCLMAYADGPVFHAMTPVKTIEVLAVGRPAVARPSEALRDHADVLYFAQDPATFLAQCERALADDGPARIAARRRHAEARGIDRMTGRVVSTVTGLTPSRFGPH